MAQRCVDALTPLWHQRRCQHGTECECLVFASRTGTQLDRHNVLRSFRTVVAAAGLTAKDWAPRELRLVVAWRGLVSAVVGSWFGSWDPPSKSSNQGRPPAALGAGCFQRLAEGSHYADRGRQRPIYGAITPSPLDTFVQKDRY